MNDAVVRRKHTIVRQTKVLGVLCQSCHLLGTNGVLNGFVLIVRRRVVVGHTEYALGTKTFQSASSHAVESLW